LRSLLGEPPGSPRPLPLVRYADGPFQGLSETDSTLSGLMRLIVARCEVVYTGRLTAVLPESTRLLMVKADGSVLVHADAGGYKPLNYGLTT
jgi:RecB family endonuclease NucS